MKYLSVRPGEADRDIQRRPLGERVSEILKNTIGSWDKKADWPPYYDTYKDLHRHPGRSGHEIHAAGKADVFLHGIKFQLEEGVFDVVTNVGRPKRSIIGRGKGHKGHDGHDGHDGDDGDHGGDGDDGEEREDFGPSVVGIFRNTRGRFTASNGPVILLRADMDALPVNEDTGLDYASQEPGCMHACGHDLHTTALMAAVQALVDARDHWTGTLIACFQPSEESGKGALGMIEGGLYGDKYGIPTPDYVFGGHVTPELAGTVSLIKGIAYSRSDSWKITLKGKGGHSSRPESAIDPIVMAAYTVTRLQTVVSRVVPSNSAGVLTIGEIGGGTTVNVIPETAYIKVNTRADSDELADKMEAHIRHIVDSEMQASMLPDDDDSTHTDKKKKKKKHKDKDGDKDGDGDKDKDRHKVKAEFEDISHMPLTKNEDPITSEIADVFSSVFESNFKYPVPAVSGSEDFSILARSKKDAKTADIPYVYWQYGSTDQKRWEQYGKRADQVPANHSPKFYPQLDIEDSKDPLKTGAMALCAAALSKFTLLPQ